MAERVRWRTWPVVLTEGDIQLRPLRRREAGQWRALRSANHDWLAPWEATYPEAGAPGPSYGEMLRRFGREARAGRMLPFAIQFQGRLVGQMTVNGISWGSLRSAHIGYWIDRGCAGRGITPTAVAMVTDYCFLALGLHRLEVNIRPENHASLRVVEKLGFRPEGMRLRFLHIDGEWRDHATFALTAEEVPHGLLSSWTRAPRSSTVGDAASSQ